MSAEEADDRTGASRNAGDAAPRGKPRRLALRAAILVVIGLLALVGYRRFLVDVQPLPLPTSTTRAILSEEGAWPSEGAGLGRTRAVLGPATLHGEVAWTLNLGSPIAAGFISDGTALYVALADQRLIAISEDEGREIWAIHLPGATGFSPTVAGNRIYVALPRGRLLSVAVEDGKVVWEVEIDSSFSASPLVSNGTLYALAGGSIFGFDADSGKELWRREVDPKVALSKPAIEGDLLAMSTTDRVLFFDRLTGEQTYWYQLPPVIEGIALADSTVYVSGSATVVAVDSDSSRPWWEPIRGIWFQFWVWGSAPQTPAPPSKWVVRARSTFAPAIASGEIVTASRKGLVTARALESGAELWNRQLEPLVEAPVFTSAGLVVVERSALLLLDPETGQTAFEHAFAVDVSAVTVTGQAIYIVTVEETLHALR